MIQRNISLKKHSNFKIGGGVSYFSEFKSKENLIDTLLEWKELDLRLPVFVLGGGTNILFNDDGFDGLILKDSISFIKRDGINLIVGSGTKISDLIDYCTQNSLSGFEWAGGLPGTVGGAIRGNAGAFKGEVKDNLTEVESLDIKSLQLTKRNNDKCKFSYRQSIFKKGEGEREIILSAKFEMKKGAQEDIKNETQSHVDYRIDRHPLDFPNIGSTFKNIPVEKVPATVLDKFNDKIKNDPFPVLPVAKLIAEAGLKGRTAGGAMVSMKHPNFIINFNNARAMDVLTLIDLIKKEIKEKFDVSLEEEIMIV